MTRTVEVTVKLDLNVPETAAPEHFYQQITDRIRDTFGESLTDSEECIRIIGAFDPRSVLEVWPDIDAILRPMRMATAVWCADDVLSVRPDLSDDQANTVLRHVRDCHDAEIGISWIVLESAAQCLFGDADSS